MKHQACHLSQGKCDYNLYFELKSVANNAYEEYYFSQPYGEHIHSRNIDFMFSKKNPPSTLNI